MVKEVRKRPCPPSQSRVDQEENDEASEEGMPKKYQRESILFYATQCARAQFQRRGYEDKEVKRRANVLRATWNQVTDQNDLVKEILEFLKDYPDRAIRQEFLNNLEYIYGEDDQNWTELRQEEKQRKKEMLERKEAEKKARGSKDKVRRLVGSVRHQRR